MPLPAVPAPLLATAPAVSAALAVEAEIIGNATITATVNAAPGRVRVSVDSTTVASSSRNTARPRESRCFTASSESSSASATSATDCPCR